MLPPPWRPGNGMTLNFVLRTDTHEGGEAGTLEEYPTWLTRLALMACGHGGRDGGVLDLVDLLVREGGARAAWVFSQVDEGRSLFLVAASRPTPTIPPALPLGRPRCVRVGDPDYAALSAFAGSPGDVLIRLPLEDQGVCLFAHEVPPSEAQLDALEAITRTIGRRLATSLPAASAFDSLEGSEEASRSGVWVSAEVAAQERGRSARFLDSIVENLPDMVFVKDAIDLRFIRFNRAGERLLGYDRAQLLGKNDYDFFPAGEADFFTAKDRQVLESGELLDIPEEPIHTSDGTRFLHTKKIPIHDEKGQPLYLLGISEDITERKAALEAIREHEVRFSSLFRNAPVGLIEVDMEAARPALQALREVEISKVSSEQLQAVLGRLRVLNVNDSARRSFGITNDQTMATMLSDRLAVYEGAACFVDALYKLLDGELVVEREIDLGPSARDAASTHALFRFVVQPDTANRFSYVLISLVDISALKLVYATLEHTAGALRRSNSELQQFAYIASHDLQEPLRIISGFSDLLKRTYSDKLDQEGHEFIDFIVDATGRMRRLIDDLLRYSRLEMSVLEKIRTPLGSIVTAAMDNLRVAIDESNVEFRWNLAELPVVNCAPGQFVQVFQNLLGNAIKFRRADTRLVVRLGASYDPTAAEHTITVEDNGIGFDSEDADRIFELFQLVHGPVKFTGTGIGLAICKRVVERHGGRIHAESRLGAGARFVLTLPDATPFERLVT